MLAIKVEDGYQFESPTINGVFIVKLHLLTDGREKLETCSSSMSVCFDRVDLEPGTIEKIIGPQRWKNFIEIKEKGLEKMFIDPYKNKTSSRTW